MESLGLMWVIVDGSPTHVSQFAALPPRRRPPARCPECGGRLTLKLGPIRRHHAAHATGDRCSATHPETALHIDFKLHIAAQLRAGVSRALRVISRCAGAGDEWCDATREREWARDWDDVVVEARVGSAEHGRRPDILLRRGGEPIGAIEVLVAHAVSEEKAAALATAGVPWIEVRADRGLLDGAAAWSLDRPLVIAREGSREAPARAWRCDRHESTQRACLERELLQRLAESEARRCYTRLVTALVVDFYEEGGARDRVIYRIEKSMVDTDVASVRLLANGREIASISATGDPNDLAGAYQADVERRTSRPGAFSDSPMEWAKGSVADDMVCEARYDYAGADPTPLATRYPRRWFYARERGEWFMPREMRWVRWDRPEGDIFAAHPAWTASHRAVRERAVAVPVWNSIAFASRPTVASFGGALRVAREEGTIVLLEAEERGRGLLVLTAAAADGDVRQLDRSLNDQGIEHLWLSHPLDWSAARADLAWAPAGRDGRARGVVVVDGLGVFRAEPFARAFARGDRRLSPEKVRERLVERVSALRVRESRR